MFDTIIVEPFLNVLLAIYSFLLTIFGTSENMFGLAIIFFTILTRLLLFPFTKSQQKSMSAMQEMQSSKQWQEIQKKYKNDKEKLAQEQMKIYQEMGVNPLGNCLSFIVQFPIIIGLYQGIIRALADTPLPLLNLSGSIYPFIDAAKVIPLNSNFLWMDLGQPERIYIMGIGIPFLAILVALTTYVQSKMMVMPTANPNDQGSQITRMMNLYMPLMLGYFAYSFASGLAVYFVTSNVATIIQYAMMGKLNWRNLIPGKKTEVEKLPTPTRKSP
jgi:YidC/Oxa1 family membrane protein insertase